MTTTAGVLIKFNFYADDLFIYLHVEPRNLADAVRMINTDISNVANWSSENGLSLNPKKTMTMIMGTTRYINSLHSCVLPRVTVNGVTIPYSDSVEYLGVTISNTLSWEKQISKTTSRVFAAVHQLKMCKYLFPMSLRIRLILSLILPLLDYSCTAFTDITKEQNYRLQRALNACIRFIYQVKWDEHISPYYEELRWLKVHSRHLYFVGNLTFSILWSVGALARPSVRPSIRAWKRGRVRPSVRPSARGSMGAWARDRVDAWGRRRVGAWTRACVCV